MFARCTAPAVRSLVLCAALFLFGSALRAADGKLRVQYFNVGQGDAALITCPDGMHHLLIDSGDNKYPGSQDNLQAALTKFVGPPAAKNKPPTTKLDVAVASHPHSDHIGGMEWVLSSYKVGTYIDNGRPAETTTWSHINELRKKQVKKGDLVYLNGKTSSETEFTLCPDVTYTLITPSATAKKLTDPNDQSVGVRLVYKQTSFLFVGDMEDHAEDAWLNQLSPAARALCDVDVLKVGHHGSDTSSTMKFIQAVSPRYAVISCGKKDTSTNIRYKHPRASTVSSYTDWFKHADKDAPPSGQTLLAYNKDTKKWVSLPRPADLWLTINNGDVTIESDGKNLTVIPQK